MENMINKIDTKEAIINEMYKIQHEKYNDNIKLTHQDKDFIKLSNYLWKNFKV